MNTNTNTNTNTKTKRLIAALGVAAASVAPALLFAGAGTAHADDDPCYGSLAGSYYCSPAAGISPQTPSLVEPRPSWMGPTPGEVAWSAVPQCSGGSLTAIVGSLSGDGCT